MAEFDHVVLTDEQETFLQRFLDYKKRTGKKAEKAAEGNRQKRADYKAFLGTEEAIDALCARLEAAGVDVGSIRQGLSAISGKLQQEGTKLTLDDALKQAEKLRRDAMELQDRSEQKQGILSTLTWIGTPPPGSNVAEAQQLTQLCRALQNSLAARPPSRDELKATLQAMGDAVASRKSIVIACATRRRDIAAVDLALGALRKRQDDAQARLVALRQLPAEAVTLASDIEDTLKAMAAGLKQQNADGLSIASACNTKALDALPKLEAMLDKSFDAHARQAIVDAGAQPVNIALGRLAKANPAAFGSAVSVLAKLREKTGGEIDDLSLAALETDVRNKSTALAEARRGENQIIQELLQAGAGQQQAQNPGQVGKRANRGGGGMGGPGALLDQVPDNETTVPLKEKLEGLRLQIARREEALKQSQGKAEAGRAVADLMEALRTGPLSAGHGREVKGPAAARLIELFGRNPTIARDCLATATTAAHPDSVARCGTIACDAMQANDGAFVGMTAQASADYAKRLVQASANCDAATMDALPAYLQNGRMGAKLPLGGRDPEARRTARTAHVRQAALRPDGKLDVAAGRDALMDVTFHPEALAEPSPMQVTHMHKTLAFFEKSPEAQAELQDVGVPAPQSAGAALVRRSTGADGAPNKQDTRAAVLNAMLTPVYQGAVGSCFATSGVIAMRETRPMEALRTLKGIASEGTYRPRKGDPVPAVDNPNVAGDPLVRSLEYSAATATAKAERSNKRAVLLERNTRAITNGLPPSIIRGPVKGSGISASAGDLNEPLVARLAAAVSKAVDFDYDPARSTPVGADGQSESGVYVMRSTKTGKVITPDLAAIEARVRKEGAQLGKPELEEAVKRAKQEAESEAGNAYWANVEPIILEVLRDQGIKMDAQLRASTKKFFLESAASGDGPPWKPTSGGQTNEAAAVILGLDGRQAEMTKEVEAHAVGPARANEVMLKTMRGFQSRRNEGEDMVVMRTVGQHGFNGLPTHPSLAPLLDGSEQDLPANFDRHVVQKGKSLRDTKLPQSRLQAMFRKDAQALAGDNPPVLQALLLEAPTEDMTPAAYQTHLSLALRMASGGGLGMPTDAQREQTARSDALVRNRMIQELDVPQFVIADTNWGADDVHVVFVMVPDPITGNLRFFQRIDPGGKLQDPPGGAEAWLRKAWATIS